MKRFKHWLYVLLLPLSLSAGFVACKKDAVQDDPQPQAVTISSIDPVTAPVGSTIAVNGTNFSAAPGSNTVTVGGVTATIVSASPTRLVVVVPDRATNGPVGVVVGEQTVQSTNVFTVTPKSAKPVVEVQGTTFANLNWTKGNVYLLRGMVYIPADYTLTIEPGTVIKGAGPEQDPTGKGYAGTLIVERRGKIMAVGTAAQPIVFTSAKPAGQRNYGDWGGVVLIGKSPINQSATTANPGGVRGTVEHYGEPLDNSGTLQYVRIEYAGAAQPNGSTARLSGLSMYGVGSATAINHVQVSHSGSDAFSWFGGTANLKNVVAYYSFDDDWSADWGYVGNLQFGLAMRNPEVADQSGSNGLELENFDSAATTDVAPVTLINGLTRNFPLFANISSFAFSDTPVTTNSVKGTGAYRAGLSLRRNASASIYNSLYYGYPEGVRLEAASTASGLTNGMIDLKGIVLANVLTPVVGVGAITNEEANAYFSAAGRANQIVPTSALAALLVSGFTSTTAPSFALQAGSPLLTGAVADDKLNSSFFVSTPYRGAFGTEDWTKGWTNFNPQATDYDK
ncbi:IPT/TIG domain-containing protein [Spirosoma fluminis]